MSRASIRRSLSASGHLSSSSQCSTHIPPTFLLPSFLPTARRTFLTKRSASNSFWAPSYPHDHPSSVSQVPFIPPVPRKGQSSSAMSAVPVLPHVTYAIIEGSDQGARKRERKQKYLDSLMDKAGELSLRCSIIDAEGNWTAEEGRYKKTELCKEHDLDPRDLRKLDSLAPNLVPLVLTRRTCILISMLHVRALIKPDRVIVFDTAGTVESEVQRRFKWHLERNIRAGIKTVDNGEELQEGDEVGLSYEHRALESIFVATANALEEEMAFTRQLVQQLLADLEDDINRDNLKRLLHYSRRMVGFQSRARYVKRAVDEILESDEDLSAMYLTSRAQGRPRALHDHEQLELLLESFTKQVEEIVSEVDTTVANMQSTQEIAELMLDSGRNALLALDVKISIATFGVGSGALVAGVFGMNLTTNLESHPYAFWIASGGASIVAIMICVVGLRILRRVRRVALSGSEMTPLRRLMSSQAWDAALASLPHGAPTELAPVSVSKSRTGSMLWNRLFQRRVLAERYRGRFPSEPVWINKQADVARARDAYRFQEMIAKEGRDHHRGNKHSGYKDFKALEAAWKGDGDCFGPSSWDSAWGGKTGKGSRWAKQ